MRLITSLALVAAVLSAVPASADNRRYRSYEDCRNDKHNAGTQGTAIGAVAGGAGTALLGGNLGGSLLGAGAGALAGNVVGRSTEKCGKYKSNYNNRGQGRYWYDRNGKRHSRR